MDPNSKDGTVLRKRPLSMRTGRKSGAHGSAEEEAAGALNSEIMVVEEEPVSPLTRLFHRPCLDCYIVGIMRVGKPLDVYVVESGLEVIDVAGGKKVKWVRTEVVVENHIVIPNLEDAGRTTTSPDQLVEDYAASLTCNSMDHSRPLWDLHILIIPTSDADAAAVAVLRLHHSLGDGTSLMSLFLACPRKASDPDSLPTIPKHYLRRPPASKRLHAGAFTGLLWLSTFVMLAWNTLVDVLRFTATSIFLKDTPTPLTGSQGVEYRPKRIVHRSVSLNDMKDVKNAMHCTVNDVLVGVTSAGLSRYLSRRYGHTGDDDSEKNQLPSNIRLRSTLLVNIRPIPGIHALAELMEGRDGETKWGNFIGYINLPFSIMGCKNPLDYIRRAKATTDRKKNSLEAIFTYKGAELIVKCFGIKALTIHFQSYMDAMKIVLTVDEAVIPDPYLLLDDLAEPLRLIKTAIPATS